MAMLKHLMTVKTLLRELPAVLDKQQQINQAGQLVADYLYNGGNPDLLLAMMGNVLLREDRNFHSIQMIEAAFRQYSLLPSSEDHAGIERVNILVGGSSIFSCAFTYNAHTRKNLPDSQSTLSWRTFI